MAHTLPAGRSEHGVWEFQQDGTGTNAHVPISFPIWLGSPISNVQVVNENETPTTGSCKGGNITNPVAASGYFCLYIKELEGAELGENDGAGAEHEFALTNPEIGSSNEVGRSGAGLWIKGLPLEDTARGVWVVTAP